MIRSTVGVNIMYERKNTNVCSRILDVQYVLRPIYKWWQGAGEDAMKVVPLISVSAVLTQAPPPTSNIQLTSRYIIFLTTRLGIAYWIHFHLMIL